MAKAKELVKSYHYSNGCSNTAVARHGLMPVWDQHEEAAVGVAMWMPPTKAAALNTFPENWQGVLSLSRLSISPDVPRNAATFLLSQSRKLIDRNKWPCLVTYADTWREHTGAIYKADNWTYIGMTVPTPIYIIDGRMTARKAGPKSRTHAEMLALGAEYLGKFPKYKFVHIVRPKEHKKGTRSDS